MGGRLAGKVALVSGAARGQGRSHALRLAEEGADILAFDVCEPVPAQGNPPAAPDDLAKTVAEIEKLDRRVVSAQLDARDYAAVEAFLAEGVGELGGLDVVVANHGITGIAGVAHEMRVEDFQAVLDTNLTAVWHVAKASIRLLVAQGRGGSVIMTSSSAGIRALQNMSAYTAAKHGVVGLMRGLAHEHAADGIRVNTIHPTSVPTPMLLNNNTFHIFRPDLDAPTAEDCMDGFRSLNLLPVPWVEEIDISNGVLYLASNEARYVTGITLPVDAGNVMR